MKVATYAATVRGHFKTAAVDHLPAAYGLDPTKTISAPDLCNLSGPVLIKAMVEKLLDNSSFLCDPDWKSVRPSLTISFY
jgi:Domain of unknown function (DUF6532)